MYIVYSKCLYCSAEIYSEEIICSRCKQEVKRTAEIEQDSCRELGG